MPTRQSLYELLKENTCKINERLFHPNFYGDDHNFLLKKRKILSGSGLCRDEALWTFLAACGYAMSGSDGVARFAEILTGMDLPQCEDSKIWLETRPLPPRKKEGNTNLDLALGSIARRETTKSGVELNPNSNSWICFCEMKWNSDISASVANDPRRNQLIRVIENAVCFQHTGQFTERLFVTLVTPECFKVRFPKSRLYQFKFREYRASESNIMKNLASPLQKRSHYPDNITERVKALTLRWVTFDDLFDSFPDSPISKSLRTFWKERNEYA